MEAGICSRRSHDPCCPVTTVHPVHPILAALPIGALGVLAHLSVSSSTAAQNREPGAGARWLALIGGNSPTNREFGCRRGG